MTDDDPDLERLFAAIDEPESPPDAFASRLRQELLEAFDERIEAMAVGVDPDVDIGVDEMIPARLEHLPAPDRNRTIRRWLALAVAASALVLLATVAVTGRDDDISEVATTAPTEDPAASEPTPRSPADAAAACAAFRRDGLGNASRAATISNTGWVDDLSPAAAEALLGDLAEALDALQEALAPLDGISADGIEFLERATGEANRALERTTADEATDKRALEQIENLVALAEPLLAPTVGVGCLG